MSFYIRNYTSEEKYDISKFMNYENGIFDVIASPFLSQLSQLPTVKYYYVNNGFREIDLIAQDAYGDPFFAYLIQYYNGDFRETFPEGTVLNLFSGTDLETLYHEIVMSQNMDNKES